MVGDAARLLAGCLTRAEGSIPSRSAWREYKRRRRAFWSPSGYRLPNRTYGWRLWRQRLAWTFAWWLIRRVVLGWMTPQGQARAIVEALGWYRPPVGGPDGWVPPGGLYRDIERRGFYVETGDSATTTFVDVGWDGGS